MSDILVTAAELIDRNDDHYKRIGTNYPAWTCQLELSGIDRFCWYRFRFMERCFEEWGREIAQLDESVPGDAEWVVQPVGQKLYLCRVSRTRNTKIVRLLAGETWVVCWPLYYALWQACRAVLPDKPPAHLVFLDRFRSKILKPADEPGTLVRIGRILRERRHAAPSDRSALDAELDKELRNLLMNLGIQIQTPLSSHKPPLTDLTPKDRDVLRDEAKELVRAIWSVWQNKEQLEAEAEGLRTWLERQAGVAASDSPPFSLERWAVRLSYPMLLNAEIEAVLARADDPAISGRADAARVAAHDLFLIRLGYELTDENRQRLRKAFYRKKPR